MYVIYANEDDSDRERKTKKYKKMSRARSIGAMPMEQASIGPRPILGFNTGNGTISILPTPIPYYGYQSPYMPQIPVAMTPNPMYPNYALSPYQQSMMRYLMFPKSSKYDDYDE